MKADMSHGWTLPLSLLVWLLGSSVALVSCACPWEEEGLRAWSDPNTWQSGGVPTDNQEVLVTQRVLLDIQPGSLANLTIQPGAALIWGNVPDLELRATYIRVMGEFHIGSDTCRFAHKATIRLYGTCESDYVVPEYGRKFLGVDAGGVLEIHGADKMSWTKLAHTIPAHSTTANCSLVYDHRETLLAGERVVHGMHVLAWQQDGSIFDFQVFSSGEWDDISDFIDGVPDGMVVAVSIRKSLATPTELFYTVMDSLGAKEIRSVAANQMYAFIVRKGDVASAVEKLAGTNETDTGYLHLPDYERGLDFTVTSTSTDVDFRVLNGDVAFPVITVSHDVTSWRPGDEVLVTSTDYEWRQAEVRRILECSACSANQITLDAPLQYMHYGEVTFNVDERAEVALLTRNILIEGEVSDSCHGDQSVCDIFSRDTFGGQTKALRGSTIHIQGVELYHMGQQGCAASYPLHLHMMDDASGTWLRNNSIHHSLSRCVTIHGTDNVEVSDNVCYDHLGHGFFLEDSVEQNVVLDRNLGVGTQHGLLLLSDKKKEWCRDDGLDIYCDALSTFWITHPNNILINNVAAGSDSHGYFYVFADKPLGPSRERQAELGNVPDLSLQYIPIKRFYNNVAHSNVKSGLFFDHKISTGEIHRNIFVPENGVIPIQPTYDPRDPPNASGVRVWTTMERLNFFKNEIQHVWLKSGNIRITNSSFADSLRGFGGGTTGSNTGAEVKDSVFVGRSGNQGMPSVFTVFSLTEKPSHQFNHSIAGKPYESVTGIVFYQGPVFVENCHFDRYFHDWWADWEDEFGVKAVTPGGAISWNRDNPYPTSPYSYVKQLTFGYCDNVENGNWVFMGNASVYKWSYRDGPKQATVRDVDGSLTGRAGTQLVRNRPLFTGPECRYRVNWGMAVCPYRYVQMEVIGSDGVLDSDKKSQFPLIVQRDDVPDDQLSLQGEQQNTYLLRTHKSYRVNFNQTLGSVPTFFKILAYGVEADDVVRVGLCLPNDTTSFKIRSDYPTISAKLPPVWAASLPELDNDTQGNMLYWDSQHGLLYFKLMSDQVRQNKSEACAGGQCIRIRIWLLDGGVGPADCSTYSTPPMPDSTVSPSVPEPLPCDAAPPAEGLGAVDREEIVTADPAPVVCKQFDPDVGLIVPEYKGCFQDKPWEIPDLAEATQKLGRSMTRQWCIDRCYRRGYHYAGLSLGKQCACGDTYGRYGPPQIGNPCNEPCKGDPTVTCGGPTKQLVEVYSTGLP